MIKKENVVLFLFVAFLTLQSIQLTLAERATIKNEIDIVESEQGKTALLPTEKNSDTDDANVYDVQLLEETQAPFEHYLSSTEQGIDKFIHEAFEGVEPMSAMSKNENKETNENGITAAEIEKGQEEKAFSQKEEQTATSENLVAIEEHPVTEVEHEQISFEQPTKVTSAIVSPAINNGEPVVTITPTATVDTNENNNENSDDEAVIELYFEDTDLLNLLEQMKEFFVGVTFITDDIVDPLAPGNKSLKGNKISFKTHKPITKKAAWDLLVTFLDLAGFALVPEPQPGFYRVITSEKAQRFPVTAYIGTPFISLPDSDEVIRYVYFIENARIETIKEVVDSLKSPTSHPIILQEVKALVITDKARNIRSLMQIIHELDQVTMPPSMIAIKLVNANAEEVKDFYENIIRTDDQQPQKFFNARKQTSTVYLPESTRIVAEPRTNRLFIFGTTEATAKIEEDIKKYIDVELEKPYSPLHTYQLRYASAITIADIMNGMTEFGIDTPAGKTGGVRGGDKYLKPMSFTPEPATNTLVIKGDYEDYVRAVNIIKKLDEPQPQVAVEALILTLDFSDAKELGTQLRNKIDNLCSNAANSVAFQTSGIRLGGAPKGIVTNANENAPGSEKLLGNLINLVTNAAAGNTVVSLGADIFGIWGIFSILQSVTNTQVVSNPFLVATNKTKSSVSVADVRRVVTSSIFAGTNEEEALGDFTATLKLEVTPQINSDGMIILKLNILFENFVGNVTNDAQAAKRTRLVDTRTIVADKEVIAIGGLIQDTVTENLTKLPILADIPILGWLFKNKRKEVRKTNLLILISTKIIEPEATDVVDAHTQLKIRDYYETTEQFGDIGEKRDPIYKRFFNTGQEISSDIVEGFLFDKVEVDKETGRKLTDKATESKVKKTKQQLRNQQVSNKTENNTATAAQQSKPSRNAKKYRRTNTEQADVLATNGTMERSQYRDARRGKSVRSQ